MWIFVLQGEMHFEASNGDWRKIAPGSAVLLEDTEGVGHFSRVLGDKPAVLAVARLPDGASKN
jgi:quercetin dioxygenase-like cupin family protein